MIIFNFAYTMGNYLEDNSYLKRNLVIFNVL